MSRIGKQPVTLTADVKACLGQGPAGGPSGKSHLTVEGPKGTLELAVDDRIQVTIDGAEIRFERHGDGRQSRALHGLTRALVANMVQGVKEGFVRQLEVVGTGYGAEVKGDRLVLSIGMSRPVEVVVPPGVEVTCPTVSQVHIAGIDKQVVGDFAARVRKVRPPEPYKGKGIRYKNEVVRRKVGKKLAGS